MRVLWRKTSTVAKCCIQKYANRCSDDLQVRESQGKRVRRCSLDVFSVTFQQRNDGLGEGCL